MLGNPFTLGVASGDPLPDGVVLWTRLAPDPLNDGGMDGQADKAVDWEVATDEDFTNVVQTAREHPTATVKARAIAEVRLAHSVHLEVAGLEPGTRYWYRFIAGDYASSAGRTRTAPPLDTPAGDMRLVFAFASCQYWEAGYDPAYRHMARDDELDLLFHLGDYIYEWGPLSGGPRLHNGDSGLAILTDYRNRHALYKTDLDLQAAHAAHPWVVTWDAHDVEGKYAGLASRYGDGDLTDRRDAAYQAYDEHMPLRPSYALGQEEWRNVKLYRGISYGKLARFCVLDTRQYRTKEPRSADQAARERLADPIADENGELRRHTMLGARRRTGSNRTLPPTALFGTSSPSKSSCSTTRSRPGRELLHGRLGWLRRHPQPRLEAYRR